MVIARLDPVTDLYPTEGLDPDIDDPGPTQGLTPTQGLEPETELSPSDGIIISRCFGGIID